MPTFTQTATYDLPVLAYPTISGLTVSGSSPGGTMTVPLILTAYSPPVAHTTVTQVTTMAVVRENFSFGGNAVADGVAELPKLTLEGTIDTPTTADGAYQVPNIVLNSIRYTYAEIMAMYFEGRAGSTWSLINPSYFRDPYGRQYNNVQVLEFSAGYVEAIPGRTTFQMTLRV